ncbi:hypothetical protein [uncultured Tateyamaria sp.]|uniref:hypothetical protein n=1 Tax=uncultured Tateyamaria sp. TaxID=455651 RepID=UPI002636D645|nr:hypothetical protein [uncultured Tateyamaria sp.]
MIARLLSLMLCLMLVLTSHSAGAARGADRAVGQMVICAGTDTVVIYVGADGTPTHAPHQCPDCALHGLDMLALDSAAPGAAPVFAHHVGHAPVPLNGIRTLWYVQARGPPRLI